MRIGKDRVTIDTLPGSGKYVGGVSYFVYDAKATEKLVAEKFVETQK